jgi:sugar lactone lactonase YvrE
MRSLLRSVVVLLVALTLGPACGGEETAPPVAATPEPAVGTIEVFVELEAPSEGLAFGVDGAGNPALYLGNKTGLLRVSAEGVVTRAADIPGPLGMATLASGELVVCGRAPGDGGKGEHPGAIWKVSPDGQATVVVASTTEAPLDLPNMIAVGPGGELVFSDSRGNRVYKVDAGASTATLLTDAITYPNGVAFSKDGSRVLVASYDGKKIWALPRDASGGYGAPEVFLEDVENVDGITPLASGGYVLVQTGEGVVRHGPDLAKTSIAPELAPDIPANGAFGVGAFGDRWLYVSNVFGKRIKRVYLGEPGAPLPVKP